jgi:hypothetical protein
VSARLLVVAWLLLATIAAASTRQPLRAMCARSELIVAGTVEAVPDASGRPEHWLARIRPERVLKGDVPPEGVVVSGTFCPAIPADETWGASHSPPWHEGRSVIAFLERRRADQPYRAVNWATGARYPAADQEAFLVEAVSQIVALQASPDGASPLVLADWVVRLAEHPSTLADAVVDLADDPELASWLTAEHRDRLVELACSLPEVTRESSLLFESVRHHEHEGLDACLLAALYGALASWPDHNAATLMLILADRREDARALGIAESYERISNHVETGDLAFDAWLSDLRVRQTELLKAFLEQVDPGAGAATAIAARPTAPVRFALLPPAPGTTTIQLADWTSLVREAFLDPVIAVRRSARDRLAGLDPLDTTPAFLNALIGLDMAEVTDVMRASSLVRSWRERTGKTVDFDFPGHTRTDEEDAARRLDTIDRWIEAWVARSGSPEVLAAWRADVGTATGR